MIKISSYLTTGVFSNWSCFQGKPLLGDTVFSTRPTAPGQHPRNTRWNVADDVGVVPNDMKH